MDSDSIQPILFMLVLVCLSAYFSATETAFSSLNRIRLKNMAENGNRRAAMTLRMAENYDRLLSTILVGNNIVNILLTTVATIFFVNLSASYGAAISTIVTTVIVLVFGEITPKSLAKDNADSFAMTSAPFLRAAMVLLYPINCIFAGWKWLVSKVFKPREEQTVTEEDLLVIVDEAQQGGSINDQESDLLRRVITFNDREAVDILIPRVEVTALDAEATREDILDTFHDTGYSRLPVYEESIDNIIGVAHYKNVVRRPHESLRQVMSPAVFVPPTMKIRLLLTKLQQEKSHIAIVADEYGGTLGIVTMEDILEELVGDIWDEHDDVVENIRSAEDGGTLVLCSTVLEDMMDYFDCRTACEAATVSGWVMQAMGCIPAEGDTFTTDGLQVEVLRVDKTHPEEIRVTPAPIQADRAQKEE